MAAVYKAQDPTGLYLAGNVAVAYEQLISCVGTLDGLHI